MTPEQQDLVVQARSSLDAARLLLRGGHAGFAASRAYYAMFYVAEALLLGKGLAFSKHSAVHAAFGKEFVKAGSAPAEFHQFLIGGLEVRSAGDYGKVSSVTPEQARRQIVHAEQFLSLGDGLLGSDT